MLRSSRQANVAETSIKLAAGAGLLLIALALMAEGAAAPLIARSILTGSAVIAAQLRPPKAG
jgi:hypothetical protein